jgi:LacI family transcriptional regulator
VVADVASVVRDNVHGMRLAVEHLAALGHHDLTYVEGPADSWADGVRWRSIREASLELGVRARRIGPFPADVASGMRAADELLAQRDSAAIAFNDVLALGVVRGLAARGCRVPADVSVVGVDNHRVRRVTPSLTTVDFSLRAMCAQVTAILGQLMRGETAPPDDRVQALPTRLVARESTAQRRRKRTSPAFGTTRVSGSDSYDARSKSSGAM